MKSHAVDSSKFFYQSSNILSQYNYDCIGLSFMLIKVRVKRNLKYVGKYSQKWWTHASISSLDYKLIFFLEQIVYYIKLTIFCRFQEEMVFLETSNRLNSSLGYFSRWLFSEYKNAKFLIFRELVWRKGKYWLLKTFQVVLRGEEPMVPDSF